MTIHVSPARKLMTVPVSPELQGLWPAAKIITYDGEPLMVLPHGVIETIMLRNLGLDAPAPILSQYSFPHPAGQPPFHVQKATAALLSMQQRAYCLNGLGTGKTRSTLWAFDYLRDIGAAHRALVVAPLSTLDNVWRKETFIITPHLKVQVLHHASKAKRLEALRKDADLYVVNTDGIKVLSEELYAMFESGELDVLILDELALMRNAKAERSKVARSFARKSVWVWGLTGSPTPNEPTDAWGQCRIITPNTVPKYFGQFRDLTMLKVGQFRFVPKRDANDHVFRAMQPSVRFTLDDIMELPPVIERTQDINLGKRQLEIYEEIRKRGLALLRGKTITAVNAGVVLSKLLQISLGYVYTSDGTTVPLDNDHRLDALSDAIADTDRKVLVFVPFTHALDGVVARLRKDGVDVVKVDGSTPKSERDHVFNFFQNTNKYKVIAAHPGCMAHGLTLTAANTIIWFGPTTSNETFEQANARIRRVGQHHKQLVLMFQATAAEKRMWARLRSKQQVQDNLLELFADASN